MPAPRGKGRSSGYRAVADTRPLLGFVLGPNTPQTSPPGDLTSPHQGPGRGPAVQASGVRVLHCVTLPWGEGQVTCWTAFCPWSSVLVRSMP